MQAKEYVAAQTVEEAVAALGRNGGTTARALAGGTDLIVMVRENRRNVDVMVDVKTIPELTEVRLDASGLTLGAAAPCWKIYEDPAVAKAYPALIDSASLIGGTAIQGRASLGGNLCNSSPAADSIPTLIALSGVCTIAGPNGRRTVPVEEFCTGPGQNVLAPGELLVSIHFPAPTANSGARFLRFIPRNEMDIAVVNAAVWVQLDADKSRIERARVAIGAVAPTPLLVREAAAAIAGQGVDPESLKKVEEPVRAAARPISDMRGTIAQRKHLVGVIARRALEGAVARAQEG